MGTVIISFSSSLFILLLYIIINFLHKFWLKPRRIQSIIASQGIKGPSYKFLYGSTKEIIALQNEIMASPMELSHHIFPRVHPHFYAWIKLYGKNILFWHGSKASLVVTEPAQIKEILSSKDKGKPEAGTHLDKILGNGLVTGNKERWHTQRKLANHVFHSESLKSMIPAMITSVEIMLERWKFLEGKEIELFNEFKLLTSDVISRTAFGSSYKEGKKIFDILTEMTMIVYRQKYTIRIPGIGRFSKAPDHIESDKLQQAIHDSIIEMINKRKTTAMMERSDSYGNDFLGSLIKANQDPDKSKNISIDVLIDECKTFYFAGHETTSSALTWTVLLLAMHADWQDRMRTEMLELFGRNNPEPDGISRLKTMSMFINESLRLYSPIVNILRIIDREVKLGQLTVPAGVDIHIPTLALHSNPEIWGEDVYLFKPERFAEGVAKATGNESLAFIPFGYGPRNCVGMSYAVTEMKIVLSMLLQRYKFSLSPSYVHSPSLLLTLIPQHGAQVILQPI